MNARRILTIKLHRSYQYRLSYSVRILLKYTVEQNPIKIQIYKSERMKQRHYFKYFKLITGIQPSVLIGTKMKSDWINCNVWNQNRDDDKSTRGTVLFNRRISRNIYGPYYESQRTRKSWLIKNNGTLLFFSSSRISHVRKPVKCQSY